MAIVRVTFDHPSFKGTLDVDPGDTTLAAFRERLKLGGMEAHISNNKFYALELGKQIAETVTAEQLHELPTEEGLYLDCDGGVWRITEDGDMLHLHVYEPPRTGPEQYMPFTELRLGRTY